MRRIRPITRLRAIIGVIALYGMLLQVFVAAATPASLVPAGVLCADHASDAPGPDHSARHEHGCCTLVQAGRIPVPSAAATAFAPEERYLAVAWQPGLFILRTGPPTHSESARGPPAA